MTIDPPSELHHVTADGLDIAYFEQGEGPLALCLHGYPDTAYTWHKLLGALAAAGYRAVAPFSRGYAPTGFPADGQYPASSLGVDANALHHALGGDGDAVLIGHDWGAIGTYVGAGLGPERWRRAVALAVPPGAVAAQGYLVYEYLKLSWYMFFQLNPLSEMVIPMNDYEYIRKLWKDWSPGFDGSELIDRFVESMATPANLTAALNYYRHTLPGGPPSPDYDHATAMVFQLPTQPLLYLHGRDDGCMSSELAAGATDHLTGESRFVMVEDAGHFLHLEQPELVNRLIVEFLSR
jgi:pimeloyl-ACP methyl ester carboxylesterase